MAIVTSLIVLLLLYYIWLGGVVVFAQTRTINTWGIWTYREEITNSSGATVLTVYWYRIAILAALSILIILSGVWTLRKIIVKNESSSRGRTNQPEPR